MKITNNENIQIKQHENLCKNSFFLNYNVKKFEQILSLYGYAATAANTAIKGKVKIKLSSKF